MKFLIAAALTGVLAWIAGMFLPWWSIAIASFIVALIIRQRRAGAWFAGFLGVFICWAIAAVVINVRNEGILAPKIATVLPLGGSAGALILLTAFIGGLAGGMGALCGALLTRRSKK